mmetsp:Transcript_8294/g.27579  ORF Transcript_8294/g.27579 Transcript_8294/m.27579 type:complete len:791 (-) Transcript_8294:77-2449(-)
MTLMVGVVLCMIGNVCMNLGTNLLKLAHMRREEENMRLEEAGDTTTSLPPVWRRWDWAFGFAIFKGGNVINFLAYGFGPQSILAALASVQFASNLVFSSTVLGETPSKTSMAATALIIAGIVTLVSTAPGESPEYDMGDLVELYRAVAFGVYMAAMVSLAACAYFLVWEWVPEREADDGLEPLSRRLSRRYEELRKDVKEKQQELAELPRKFSSFMTKGGKGRGAGVDYGDGAVDGKIERGAGGETRGEGEDRFGRGGQAREGGVIGAAQEGRLFPGPVVESVEHRPTVSFEATSDKAATPWRLSSAERRASAAAHHHQIGVGVGKEDKNDALTNGGHYFHDGEEGALPPPPPEDWYSGDSSSMLIPLCYSIYSAVIGTQTVTYSKMVSCLLRITVAGDNQFVYPLTYVFFLIFVGTGVFWDKQLNQGLGLFDAMTIVPLMQAAWTLLCIINGGVYFQEFNAFTPEQSGAFCAGLLIVLLGMALLIGGQSVEVLEDEEEEEEEEDVEHDAGAIETHLPDDGFGEVDGQLSSELSMYAELETGGGDHADPSGEEVDDLTLTVNPLADERDGGPEGTAGDPALLPPPPKPKRGARLARGSIMGDLGAAGRGGAAGIGGAGSAGGDGVRRRQSVARRGSAMPGMAPPALPTATGPAGASALAPVPMPPEPAPTVRKKRRPTGAAFNAYGALGTFAIPTLAEAREAAISTGDRVPTMLKPFLAPSLIQESMEALAPPAARPGNFRVRGSIQVRASVFQSHDGTRTYTVKDRVNAFSSIPERKNPMLAQLTEEED